MQEIDKIQMRKRNMKLFPTYKTLSWDYIFFYTIHFLFLTQVKNINPADVVLIDSFYYLFAIFAQIPSTFIIEFLGRKNSLILGNVLGCVYILLIIFSKNIFYLAIAELINSISFAIKESAEPSILNESIPPTKNKSKIFAKLNEKGMANYHIVNAISMVIAGILYEINPYAPFILSLLLFTIVTLLSMLFIEPVSQNKKDQPQKIKSINQIKELKNAFKFVLKSERIKGLILYSIIIVAIISILNNYEISMLEDLNISASYMGILFAILGIISGLSAKKQEQFHNKYKNKSLSILGFLLIGSTILSGISGIIAKQIPIALVFIIIFYIVKYATSSMYYILIDKYLSNFTNEKIDTKIFTANNFLKSITSAIFGIFAAFLLDRMETAYCMVILGIIFFIIMILVSKFMKSRVGLKPDEYSKEEIKYDKMINV